MSERIDCFARRRNLLGEGPVWDERSGRLYWVDIKSGTIESAAASGGSIETLRLGVRPTALAVRQADGFIVASAGELGVLDGAGRYERRLSLDMEPDGNRTNDGNVGADGRFWFGTMDDAEQEVRGAVYSLDPDWTLRQRLAGIKITNALVTSPDGTTLYVADSALGVIRAYPVGEQGELGPPAASVSTAAEGCAPDGAAVDEEGFIWSAQWDGWRIVRYTPDLKVDRIIPLPVARPTKCVFGGPKRRTLFVTSASIGLSDEELEAQPLAGSVLVVEVDARGAEIPAFAG